MQDNAILQRTLYKYEQTLSDLDSVFRGAHGSDVILELKRVTEKQLKEIVKLQNEVEIVKYNSGASSTPLSLNNTRKKPNTDLDNDLWSHTADNLKSPKRKLKALQLENEELHLERKQLLGLCEDLETQIKESHKSLEDSLEKIIQLEKSVEDRDKELEEVRRRVTLVAVLFEKKEIKQKYSFEVLCDFIYDKAKRLFLKFENAMIELKTLRGGGGGDDTQKKLEADNEIIRQTLMKNNSLANEITNRFMMMIGGQEDHHQDGGGVEGFKQVASKIEYSYLQIRQENVQLKERVQELAKLLES